jgi:tRNA pseudouridine55 synthase
VTVHSFELLSDPHLHNGLATVSVRTNVSSGTYIRVLAQDLAAALGTVAYVKTLRRTSIDTFKIENAQKLEDITSENWQSFLVPHLERSREIS